MISYHHIHMSSTFYFFHLFCKQQNKYTSNFSSNTMYMSTSFGTIEVLYWFHFSYILAHWSKTFALLKSFALSHTRTHTHSHTHIHTHTQTHTHAHTHSHTHAHTRSHSHTLTHAHTLTHTLTHSLTHLLRMLMSST